MKNFSIGYGSVFSVLLAKEDIFIEIDPSLTTAHFDLDKRILRLPSWEGSHELQRFLICHEVSHAIFTPPKEWSAAILSRPSNHQRVYKDILNVFEDVRVDRLMQEKYVVMKKWYFEGVRDLIDTQDLWGLKAEPDKLNDFGLIDLINLYFKTKPINNIYKITFDSNEQIWIDRANAARTFEQVKKIADDFFDEMDDDEKETENETTGGGFCITNGELEELAEEMAMEGINASPSFTKVNTLYIPDSDYRHYLHSLNHTVNYIQHDFSAMKPLVNHMVSIFERKKNARMFSNVLTTNTGVLDPLKLHSYKYNEDILLKKMVVNKQKNHGFIMIVDMSQSMTGQLHAVTDHLYLLASFCKRISVPFCSFGFEDKGTNICELTGGQFRFNVLLNSNQRMSELETVANTLKNAKLTSGTPLTSAVHHTKTMALEFKESHNIDILNVIFLTDGGCTKTIHANHYVDVKSRMMLPRFPNYLGSTNAVGPLMQIIRDRAQANVWVYHVGKAYDFKQQFGGTTGAFFIPTNALENNPKFFLQKIIEQMV